MRKVKNVGKLFLTLTLSVAMLVTEMPMTAFAVSTETVSVSEKEATEEQTQTEVITEEGLPEDETGEITEEVTKEDEESSKGEASGEDSKNEESSKDEASDEESNSEENSEERSKDEASNEESKDEESSEESSEEAIAEQDEAGKLYEAMLLSSDSDFVINDGVLTGYNGTAEDIVIPDGVVTIKASVFKDNTIIKTVSFPSSVKTIENYAFSGCSSLGLVNLNEGLETIGIKAFSGVSFGETSDTGKVEPGTLTIPSTVRSIELGAFYNCAHLGEVIFADGDTAVLEIGSGWPNGGAFSSCPNLKKVTLPSRLKKVSTEAFRDNLQLSEVIMGDHVETIGESAFSGCSSLKGISFPSSLKTIENYAFQGCSSLDLVNLNEGLETIGIKAFSGTALGETSDTGKVEPGTLTIPSTVRSIGLGAFYNCAHLGEVVFADGDTAVLEIGSGWPNGGAFSSCPNLKKVTLPSRLKKVSTEAFRDNLQLSEVIMGDHVETIGESAFSGCSSLKGISFPSSLKTIENNAFYGCSSLGLVNLNEGLETIGVKAFSGTALGETSDTGKVEPGTLTIPSTVRSIELGAFYNCAHLGEVLFADGDTAVLEIGSGWPNGGAFSSCPNLTKVILPSRLKKVSTEAFRDNPQLSEVIMGDHVETIGESAFSGCSSLKGINFPSSLRTIENYAFQGCSSLGLVNLNEGLETIGVKAFSGAGLGEMSDAGKIEPGTLTIPSTVRSIGAGAFYNCTHLGKVIFADGDTAVLEISGGSSNNGAFGSCPELTTVILPERIAKLGSYTFYADSKLHTLYIPSKVTEIASNAISNCPNLTIYGVSGSAAETYAKENKIPFKNKDEIDSSLEVQSVQLTPSFIEETGEDAIGKKIQLSVQVLPDTAQNKEVVYQSADESVVTVDSNGLVTINGYGETTITVTTVDGGKTAECKVTILKEAVDDRPIINTVLFPKNQPEYSAVYTGEQIRPVMAVSYQYTDDKGVKKTQKLRLNVDYTVFYSNNVNAGQNTAKVTVTGIGEYKGVITKKFTITPKDIKDVALSPVGDIVFGDEPSVVVTDGTHELTKTKDYKVVLSTTGSAGTDTQSVLTVEGVGNYKGTSKKSVKFNILKKETDIHPIVSDTVSVEFKKLPAKGYTYSGKAQKPAVVVTDKSTGKKVAASNYKVIYTNNINAGTAKIQVVGVSKNGKGYYGISKPLTFTIKPKDFGKVKVSLTGTIPKAGTIKDIQNAIDEALTLKDGKHVLSEDEYTVDYGDIKNVNDIKIGTRYPITLTAKAGGNYVENSKKTVYIKFGQLSLASKTANVSVRITNAEKNEILLSYNGIRLEKDRDYTAVVTKDKKKGTYTVKIKAVKNSAYKGSRTIKNLTN